MAVDGVIADIAVLKGPGLSTEEVPGLASS